MRRARMTPTTMEAVAARFRALGEPARLRIVHALRGGERCVSELEAATALNQANLSRHLQVLAGAGMIRRRKEGLFAFYSLADTGVLRVCEIMCGRAVRA